MGELYSTNAIGTGVSVQSSVVPEGSSYALRLNPSAEGIEWAFRLITSGGGAAAFAKSATFFLRIASLPIANSVLILCGTTNSDTFTLNSNGTVTLDAFGSGSVTSSNAFTADGLWHFVVWDNGWNSGAGRRLYVDSTEWASDSTITSATNAIRFGRDTATVGTYDIYIARLTVYDGPIPSPSTLRVSQQKLLIPTAGNSANSWVNGGGGTGNISGAVDNIPPIGAAASTDGTKIKNAASGGNLDYTATLQSYSAAGIPAGSIINAVQAICNDGEEVATSTKAGAIWCASNPAQSAGTGTFDFGNDVGALATFPTNWKTHFGVVTESPSVTLATAPTLTVRKTSSTTRVVDVDFMGLYVDYTPPLLQLQFQNYLHVRAASGISVTEKNR